MRCPYLIGGVDVGTIVAGYALVEVTSTSPLTLKFHRAGIAKQPESRELGRRLAGMAHDLAGEFDAPALSRAGTPLVAVGFEQPHNRGTKVRHKTIAGIGAGLGAAVAAVALKAAGLPEEARPGLVLLEVHDAKRVLTGNGNATKDQVAGAVMRVLGLSTKQMPQQDATDAMAIAVAVAMRFASAPRGGGGA
jgi:Holliday junction resolvasome RuvABC endonuclease subunit